MIYLVLTSDYPVYQCGDEYTAVRALHWMTQEYKIQGGQIQKDSYYRAQFGVVDDPLAIPRMRVDMGGMILMGTEEVFTIRPDLEIQIYGPQYLSLLTALNREISSLSPEDKGFVKIECSMNSTCLSLDDAVSLRNAILAKKDIFKQQESKFLYARTAAGFAASDPKVEANDKV